MNDVSFWALRRCFLEPIPEILAIAKQLGKAEHLHCCGDYIAAEELIMAADLPVLREWCETLWGGYNEAIHRQRKIEHLTPILPKSVRIKVRMPDRAQKIQLIKEQGRHCRFCGVPLIRKEVRESIRKYYPRFNWGKANKDCHAAFMAMWLNYDHLLPHARGGDNSLENIVITCAPCNFARSSSTIEEVGLLDPRDYPPIQSDWNGLEGFLSAKKS